MDTAVRNLDIVTRLKGSEEVKQGFDDMNKSAEKLKGGVGNATGQVFKFEDATTKLATKAENVAQSLTVLGGIVGGSIFAGAVIIGVAAMMDFKKELDELGERLKTFESAVGGVIGQMLKFKDPIKIRFELDDAQTDKLLEWSKSRRDILEQTNKAIWRSRFGTTTSGGVDVAEMSSRIAEKLGIWSALSEEEQKQLKYNEGIVKAIDEQLYSLEAQKMLQEDMAKLGVKAIEDEKKKTKEIEKQIEITGGRGGMFGAISSRRGVKSLMAGVGIGDAGTSRADITLEERKYKEILEKRADLEREFIYSTASIMTSEFGQAWENIFGEANSLFEKLAASWAETLASNVFSGLLSMLPGGGVLSWLFGGGGSGGASQAMRAVTQANIMSDRYRVGA